MARGNWPKVFLTAIIICCLYSCSQASQQMPSAPYSDRTSTPIFVDDTVAPSPVTTERAFKQTETASQLTAEARYEQTITAFMSTRDALSEYVTFVQKDKADWVIYNPKINSGPEPAYTSLAIAPNGDIWVTGSGKASRFDDSQWITYLIPDGKSPEDTNYSSSAVAIGQDNSLWVGGTNYSLFRFDGNTWHIELESISIEDIEINPIDGTVWIAENDIGIRKYDGTNWTAYTTEDGLIDDEALDITIDKSGIIWVISRSGISSYDGQVWNNYPKELFCADSLCDLYGQFPNSIISASDGSIWFTVYGVALFHYTNGSWERYENQTIFLGQFQSPVVNMCFSPNGILWLGKWGRYSLSLSYFDGEDWYVPYILSDTGEKLSGVGRVNDIACADDGSIWIVSASMGVVHYIP